MNNYNKSFNYKYTNFKMDVNHNEIETINENKYAKNLILESIRNEVDEV